ncbi:hypothetical protein NW764_005195 [Fusarium oxysporum]|nr:hypothetical protein NW764_005195 [Fusarium oxysporum]
MSRRLSILKGDDLVPDDSIHPETPSLTKTNPLMRQVVTPPSLSSSQSEDTDMDSYHSNLPVDLKPSVIPPCDDVPPGHVRLLGGFICPADPAESKEDDNTEASVYHCPADILEPKDAGEFPGEKTQGDGKPEVTSPKAPQPPMLYLRGISTPPVPAGPTSSPFQGYSTLCTRPITPYHPKPIVPGLPEPIGPHPAQPIVYYHAESIDPRAQAVGVHPFQPMVAHYSDTNNPEFVQPLTPYNSQAVAIHHPQRISSLGEMLSPSPSEAPTPTPPHRCSITTFNPEASEFTPSPTGPGMDNPEATDFALSPTGSGIITYEASEFTHNPTDLGMIHHEEAGVEGFGGLDANSQAPMVETIQDTYSQILAIEDERDREDAINDFYYKQARPWTDEDTRREKEEQELEERKRRFGRKN